MLFLDTCAVIHLADSPHDLPKAAYGALEQTDRIYCSAISALEIGLLVRNGRIKIALDVETWFNQCLEHFVISEIPVSSDIALLSAKLPLIHRDPFDQIIIATANRMSLPIVTSDRKFSEYPGTRVIWN